MGMRVVADGLSVQTAADLLRFSRQRNRRRMVPKKENIQ